MKYLIIGLLTFVSSKVVAQQNLIPNGGFENVNPTNLPYIQGSVNCVAPCDDDITVHHVQDYDNRSTSIIKCWWMSNQDVNGVGTQDSPGITYLIAPDLYTLTGGNTFNSSGLRTKFIYELNGVQRIFSADTQTPGTVGLNLQPNVFNGLSGFDCSPPDTKFGTGMNAPEGTNYLAMIDFNQEDVPGATVATQGSEASKPSITCELEAPLEDGVEYSFVMTRAMMNEIQNIAANEGWSGGAVNVEIEVHLAKNLNGTGEISGSKQEIVHESNYSNTSWETDQWTFTATNDWKYLRIRFNPVGYNGNKISGIFIDNLKLYEACEDQFNQCNNTNYRRDLLDVNLETVDVTDPLAYPDPNQGNDNYLKTIKAVNLDNVKRFEMQIRTSGGTIVRTIDEWYPPSQFVWDGNDDGGNPLPEGSYEARINAVSNDCFHISNADVKNFNLRRRYTVFNNVQVGTAVVPSGNGSVTVPAITGLDEVQWLRVIVTNALGQQVFNQAYYNPPSEMLLSTSFGNVTSNPPPPTGPYAVVLEMSNNCQSANLGNNWDHKVEALSVIINAYTNYNVDPNLFNWVTVSKPDFQCPFNFEYSDNYLPPRDCCEGYLYIEDVDILNDFDVQIQYNIYFGDNVSFGVNANNNFYAGNVIFGEPGLTIPNGANVLLQPGTYTCMVCRESNPNTPPRTPQKEYAIALELEDSRDESEEILDSNSGLYPNPVRSGGKIKVSLISTVDETAKFELLDGVGRRFTLEPTGFDRNEVSLKIPEGLSDGVYYLQVSTNGMMQSFKVQIRN